ncbi:ribonucleotide reductase subunit 1 [Gallid alphaherpesvirus 1]|uniref:Ribonucleoside-diphosphate reductase large subunit n=1 Tax=Infectious laryngotracheitis virus TaxID=10386 RepID=A0A0K0K610_ILTV|nr:ribonucleotide reductase subunit 1 [Gallid alphaherpesvirus 1]
MLSFFDELESIAHLEECLRDIETRMRTSGFDPKSIIRDDFDIRAGREGLANRISMLVDGFKVSVLFNVELYRLLAELVHLRIRTKAVSFSEWLDARGLSADCKQFILENAEHISAVVKDFYNGTYHQLARVGLQSAQKYESLYLGKLGNGKLESMGQFFTRLSAEAARGAFNIPQFAQALEVDGQVTPADVFTRFFTCLSSQLIVPPTPVMLFGGTSLAAYASCFLIDSSGRNTREAFNVVAEEVIPIMNNRGGIGISLPCLGAPQNESGCLGFLKALDSLVAASNGAAKRPTGLCVYFEPWHCDTLKILKIRGSSAGNEEFRCDNIFTAIWMPDLFMKRLQQPGSKWTLFDHRGEHLSNLFGEEFEKEYERLERENVGVATIPITEIMFQIIKSAVSTGTPFVVFKDAFNRHYFYNMQHRALKCSNLCTEIAHMADSDTVGVCNLISINLAAMVKNARAGLAGKPGSFFDYELLRETARTATIFANVMISLGNMPSQRAQSGNHRLRSLGVGVQGLHTACLMQGFGMTSVEGFEFNDTVFELLALETTGISCRLCELGLPPFDKYRESYYALGWLHIDGWPNTKLRYKNEWDSLRHRIDQSGLYNCQTVALMPTASSSQITEVSEGFQPVFGNMFSKISTTGEEVRPHLALMDAIDELYSDQGEKQAFLANLKKHQWSVRAALGSAWSESHVLAKFQTAFELDQEKLLYLSARRAPFIDHSQSNTLYITEDVDGTLSASRVSRLLQVAFKYGLKTAMYYCKVRKITNNGVFVGSCGDSLICSACQ